MYKQVLAILTGLLLWAFLINYNLKTPQPYVGDLTKNPDILTLGENIYEGFEIDRFIDREYECFLRAVYIEAYAEGVKGQQAVAQVLYNRYISSKFPQDMCDVIAQRQGRVYQFPWMKDWNKRNLKLEEMIIEEMSQHLASIYVGGYTVPKLERATYFKRCDIPGDSWWHTLKMVAKVGDHCFYQVKGK